MAIPAKGSIQYATQAVLRKNEKGLYWNFGLNDQDYLVLNLPVEGKYVLRAQHEVPKTPSQFFEPDSRWVPKEHNIQQGWSPDASAPFWEGILTSNEITVEVKAAGKSLD